MAKTKIEEKPWYMSKTMWAAIALAVMAVFEAYSGRPTPEIVFLLANSLGFVGIRTAKTILTK